ncbi:MAG: ferrous iron transport protein A [Alphaproteobacteria bacterium]|jgi:Fe2+ transport system protein FeoA|nr:ferrous iron transport protein A [Alphaproteobacteria bacterium]
MNDLATIFLSKAKLGKTYYIVRFANNLSFYEKDRLLSYGFFEGNSLKVLRKSVFGSTFQVRISDYNLVLRKKEANMIVLQEESNES